MLSLIQQANTLGVDLILQKKPDVGETHLPIVDVKLNQYNHESKPYNI